MRKIDEYVILYTCEDACVKWGTCALRHRGRCGRESQCRACLGACLGGIAFCGQFLCFAFQSFRHRSAVFLYKVLHKKQSLSACLGARLVPLQGRRTVKKSGAAQVKTNWGSRGGGVKPP